jgi:hypothetical protein
MKSNTVFTNEEEMIFNLFRKFWRQMVVVEPIFTLITLNHIIFNVFKRMRLFAITITIKIVLIIIVLFIFIIQFLVE